MQHDSVFGFMDAVPFPDAERPPNGFHVGCGEGSQSLTFKRDVPDGSKVTWGLFRTEKRADGQPREELVCSYTHTTHNGTVRMPIPVRYARWLQQGTAGVRLMRDSAA
jgi:hypothetical protein